LVFLGQPDNAADAMAVARKFQARIDTVFVGPESDGLAQKFLRELAAASGGKHVKSDNAQDLAQKTQTLLLA
jgi:NAD(P)H-hydrate repair Nnr-like enzyme with NAD(P)H-hydrate epimerase domain